MYHYTLTLPVNCTSRQSILSPVSTQTKYLDHCKVKSGKKERCEIRSLSHSLQEKFVNFIFISGKCVCKSAFAPDATLGIVIILLIKHFLIYSLPRFQTRLDSEARRQLYLHNIFTIYSFVIFKSIVITLLSHELSLIKEGGEM